MNAITTTSEKGTGVLSGDVKWYDADRGFGFVVVPGFEDDFLLHRNVIQNLGRMGIVDGSHVTFRFESAGRGFRITELLSVEEPHYAKGPQFDFVPDNISDAPVPARVKWFDPHKGYGFVNEHRNTEDIFIGQDVLKHSAVGSIQAGQAISVQVAENDGRKIVYRVHEWF